MRKTMRESVERKSREKREERKRESDIREQHLAVPIADWVDRGIYKISTYELNQDARDHNFTRSFTHHVPILYYDLINYRLSIKAFNRGIRSPTWHSWHSF